MKKRMSLICFVIVMALVLSACSSNSSGGGSNGSSKKEVTAWAWNINVPVLKKAAELYEKEHPGFKLKVTELGREDVYSKLTTGLQAGGKGLPDIVLVEDDHFQGYMNAFPKAFVNLSDKGFDKSKDKFPTYKADLLSKDGKMYAFPFDSGPTGVFYRKDFFDKAGVKAEDIKTWDDFIAAGKKIKAKAGVDLLGLDKNGDDGLYRMMMNQQGAFYFDEKGKLDLTSKESQASMETIKKMKDANLLKNTVGWDAWISAMANGKVATAPSGAWLTGSIEQQAKDTKGKWGVMPLPAMKEGDNRAANLGGSNYVITSASGNQDKAYKFMEFFSTSDDVQLEAMKGGLFPSLSTVYDNEMFTKPDEFFSNQTIWKTFADEMKDIPAANYTGDYALTQDEVEKAQSETLGGKDAAKALKEAQDRVANRIGQ
ncbi:ABC transporter substrate-binding protein [Fictibacillus fluitans]|uniref:Sugar ABC transporter substrate-binding protein n=1 Tax=Fictibacillus fluitans TaxID=3058422 RepID=A0ABT8HT04_9BACL|nr:sugar ABC transporter substrate-binding protein [Fictibacillus sp. NE201]MDN4523876.1 sugar ABC transporter substrate-binding protein [Fictibacillus sp. NE201]